ncbi:MAG TPA: hypothetical protein PK413_01970 [Thermoanaerobaculia bacterium]|nr:hypothetical protein [Thermoanaerobaculia bacterium]
MSFVERGMFRAALIGGLALGAASAIPPVSCLNCACCALVIGGGVLAAYLYFKDQPASAQVPYGDGAVLGALAGLVGAVTDTVIELPVKLLANALGFGAKNAEALNKVLSNPDVPEGAKRFMAMLMSPGGTIAGVFLGLAMKLVIFGIFAMIGGLIGASMFAKKSAAPPPPAPPPIPPWPPAASGGDSGSSMQ